MKAFIICYELAEQTIGCLHLMKAKWNTMYWKTCCSIALGMFIENHFSSKISTEFSHIRLVILSGWQITLYYVQIRHDISCSTGMTTEGKTMQCRITWSIFSKFSYQTRHSSHVRERYGVPFVSTNSDLNLVPVTSVVCIISRYITLRYNVTRR